MRFNLITANHWTKSYTKKDILSCFVFFILQVFIDNGSDD